MNELTVSFNSIDITDKVAAETDMSTGDIKAVFNAVHKVVVEELKKQKKRIESGVPASEIKYITIPGVVCFNQQIVKTETRCTSYGIYAGINKLLISEVFNEEEQ